MHSSFWANSLVLKNVSSSYNGDAAAKRLWKNKALCGATAA
jgi:hypothetical protein